MFLWLHKWVAQFPEELLTIALAVVASVAIIIAVFGKPLHKALACAYFVLPI